MKEKRDMKRYPRSLLWWLTGSPHFMSLRSEATIPDSAGEDSDVTHLFVIAFVAVMVV